MRNAGSWLNAMSPGWRICAAAILITGSISSTSGATTPLPECAGERPGNALAVIAGLEIGPNDEVGYVEEVHHAALPRPEIARGVLGVTSDGRLLKDQRFPKREISKIGERFISVSETPDGPVNLLPIPAELRPMLDAIRLVITGDTKAIEEAFVLDLQPEGAGWRIGLVSRDPDAPEMLIALIGCATVLRAIEIEQGGGISRTLTLERQK